MAYVKIEEVLETARNGYHTDFGRSMADLTSLREVLEDAPTADVVEAKHGEWVRNEPNPEQMKKFHDMGIGKAMTENSIYWTCSCCGTWGNLHDHYCHHCGAKMDGGKVFEDLHGLCL